ncbi:MAG TPA: METTL5 family protein [Candidatus Nanoarchaeia archaeon]|nr:METTL5 family protein [Candidatus Nanoarchaeia archaeon]
MFSSKARLSRELGRVKSFSKPKLSLRQYMTPPAIASDLLWTAFMNGDLEGKTVFDLGVGTGMLAIGASLLGAKVTGFDVDSVAISETILNAKELGVSLLVFEEDISGVSGSCDTVIMNPPFMVKGGVNDKVFLEKAFTLASRVYSVHTAQTRDWVSKFALSNGFSPVLISSHDFLLPKEFAHQSKERGLQKVDLWFFSK